MEAEVVNAAGSYASVGNIYRRASLPGTSPTSRRAFASFYSKAQAQDAGHLQNSHSENPTSSSHSLAAHSFSSSSSSSPSSSCLTINRDILPGEVIKFPGMILVKGNVNCGAAIHASSDIIVLGQLEGEAHAGRHGDTCAVIFAWKLTSKTLSIAGHVVRPSLFNGGDFCKVASLSYNEVRVFDADTKDFRFSRPKNDSDYSPSINGPKSWFAIDWKSMRQASKVATFTGAYIFIVGIVILLFPESFFGLLFDFKSSARSWIRVGGVLAAVFGIYYIGTAWGDAKGGNGANSFYVSTIVGRAFIFLSFWWLAVHGALGLSLFAVGTVNLIGALTMLNALRKENLQQRSA